MKEGQVGEMWRLEYRGIVLGGCGDEIVEVWEVLFSFFLLEASEKGG